MTLHEQLSKRLARCEKAINWLTGYLHSRDYMATEAVNRVSNILASSEPPAPSGDLAEVVFREFKRCYVDQIEGVAAITLPAAKAAVRRALAGHSDHRPALEAARLLLNKLLLWYGEAAIEGWQAQEAMEVRDLVQRALEGGK